MKEAGELSVGKRATVTRRSDEGLGWLVVCTTAATQSPSWRDIGGVSAIKVTDGRQGD